MRRGRQVLDWSHCRGFKAACAQTLKEMQEVSRYATGHNTAADAVLQRDRVEIQQQTCPAWVALDGNQALGASAVSPISMADSAKALGR
jgi:hypothetical protein